MAEVNRREFLAAAAAMATACALCGSMAYADDNDAWKAAKDLPAEKFEAGRPDDFTKDAGNDKFGVDKQVLITRKDAKIVAMTAVCPHKKALVVVSDNSQYECPHHHSRFTLEGDPTPKPNGRLGPAHDPLVHYAIHLDEKGKIIVDTGTTFGKEKWNDAGAFIQLRDK